MNSNQSNFNLTITEVTYFQTIEKSPTESSLTSDDLFQSNVSENSYIVPDSNCIYISSNLT